MNRTVLDHVLRHNTWATGALLGFCRALEPAALRATAPGTYGALYETLQHIVGAEQWYVKLLTGDVIGRPIRRTDAPHSFEELAEVAAAAGARLQAVAASDDPARVIPMGDEHSTVGVILAQVVHHGNEHRAQATTILGANGIEPLPLSSWAYGRAVGISTNGE